MAALEARDAAFDLVIVNGEGSIHGNSRAAMRAARIARDLERRKSMPAYLVNATIEGNARALDEALGAFRLRFVRDTRSQQALACAGVAAEVVHDLVLTARHLPQAAGRGSLLATDASDQTTTERLIALARSRSDAQAVTLRAPPPWPARGSASRRIGFEVKRAAARFSGPSPWSLRYAGAVPSAPFVERLATDARALVCGRYHAACLALRMSLPFVAIEGNTAKTSALLADVGLEARMTTLEALERSGPAFEIPAFSVREAECVAQFLANVEARAPDMFRRIAADAHAWRGSVAAAA
jgi:hypothetical protein